MPTARFSGRVALQQLGSYVGSLGGMGCLEHKRSDTPTVHLSPRWPLSDQWAERPGVETVTSGQDGADSPRLYHATQKSMCFKRINGSFLEFFIRCFRPQVD